MSNIFHRNSNAFVKSIDNETFGEKKVLWRIEWQQVFGWWYCVRFSCARRLWWILVALSALACGIARLCTVARGGVWLAGWVNVAFDVH